MFVDLRIDLSGIGPAFVAVLVLGVVLVLLSDPLLPPLPFPPEAGGLLPVAVCLAAGARGAERGPR